MLPGPPTERRRWRDGAPYSPNFLAAYSAYRLGLEVVEGKTDLLKTAASELETLLNKGQSSPETVYVLNLVYARLGDSAGRDALAARVEGMKGKLDFRVDDAAVTPEDRANLAVAATPSGSPLQIPANTGTNVNNPNGSGSAQSPSLMNPGSIPVINASDLPRGKLVMPPLVGAVPRLQTKFALIVSNSESRLPNGALPFALEDARRLREALITSAGYDGANIETVTNATAANVLAVAKALAERTNDQSTVFVYYTGMGTNVDGRDYLAGVDTDMFTDTTSMIPEDRALRAVQPEGGLGLRLLPGAPPDPRRALLRERGARVRADRAEPGDDPRRPGDGLVPGRRPRGAVHRRDHHDARRLPLEPHPDHRVLVAGVLPHPPGRCGGHGRRRAPDADPPDPPVPGRGRALLREQVAGNRIQERRLARSWFLSPASCSLS